MTTIGYGDRAPQTNEEIVFVIASQMIGLSIFATFLLQIQKLYDVRKKTDPSKLM